MAVPAGLCDAFKRPGVAKDLDSCPQKCHQMRQILTFEI